LFPKGYFDYAVGNAFGRLYNNYDGLLDSFAAFWQQVASRFKGFDNVLGYELMNEPWAGDTWADPTLLIPGNADRKVLGPAWSHVAKAIRKVDKDAMIFFAGVTFDILSGFEDVPEGRDYRNKSVLSYHYYKV
jgi:endoglycosylceramidase